MCGIAGYFGKTPPGREFIDRTLDRMKNRGPDHQGDLELSLGNFRVCLLHSRLSIIDLDSRSNQPFSVGDLTIVFNGEIYNYVELARKLRERGIELRTASDTEVLLHYYRIYGERCVGFFEGMWAFAIADRSQGCVFLSRDRFGEKPLYFLNRAEGVYFGSEIKFLKSLYGNRLSINQNHLLRHLAHGYKSLYKSSETYFKEVERLDYGESLRLEPEKPPVRFRYWKPEVHVEPAMTEEEAIAGVKTKLLESVRLRMRSDVPVAFCLSGGVDSSSLVSIAAKVLGADVKTFSIIDEDARYNEEENICATVRDLGCESHLIEIPKEGTLDRLKELIEYHEVPVSTISYYVHSLISERVQESGCRVIVSGTGADELFTGYYDHFLLHLHEVRCMPEYPDHVSAWKREVGRFVRNPVLKDPDLYAKNEGFRAHVFDASKEIEQFLLPDIEEPFRETRFCNSLFRNRMLNELFEEIIPVILHEDDLNSMRCSLENRSPFLDSKLFSFACSIPGKYLISRGYNKFILREAMAGILNEQVRLDRQKKGFNASINSVIDLADEDVRGYLLDPNAEIFEVIDREKMEEILDLYPIPNHFSKFVFNFINARMFLELS